MDVAISEDVRALLIRGHARAGRLTEAEEMWEKMKNGSHPAITTSYVNLLWAYADRGLTDKIKKVRLLAGAVNGHKEGVKDVTITCFTGI